MCHFNYKYYMNGLCKPGRSLPYVHARFTALQYSTCTLGNKYLERCPAGRRNYFICMYSEEGRKMSPAGLRNSENLEPCPPPRTTLPPPPPTSPPPTVWTLSVVSRLLPSASTVHCILDSLLSVFPVPYGHRWASLTRNLTS
jgi:hypothetical protein